MYLSSYAELYDMSNVSLRFGNVFGPRSSHGVIFDFFQKLKRDKNKLIIFGNGKQRKSYLFIQDCVEGFIKAMQEKSDKFQSYNIAGDTTNSVIEIADLVTKELDISPSYEFTGGDRGWKGDVRIGELDTKKLQNLGWKPRFSTKKGISLYIDWLKTTYGWIY